MNDNVFRAKMIPTTLSGPSKSVNEKPVHDVKARAYFWDDVGVGFSGLLCRIDRGDLRDVPFNAILVPVDEPSRALFKVCNPWLDHEDATRPRSARICAVPPACYGMLI
jgi:hypothetical protein